MGSGEWGVGSGEWGVGSGEWGVGSGGRAVERRSVNRGNGGSIPPTAGCLSEETLKAGGPFYLVSMPGGKKNPTQAVNA